MPSSNAIVSVGTKFYRWDGSNWISIAEIIGIDGPNKTKDTIEVTTLLSTDRYKEFLGELKDGGTVALDMNFSNATYDIMSTDFEDNDTNNYAIVFIDTDRSAFELVGILTELGLGTAVGDKVSAPVTIKVTGKPTLSDGSSGLFP